MNAGDVIGTPSTQYLCGETGTSNFVHTHFAFLQKTGTYTGSFIPMADANNSTTLCGANVLTNAVAPGGPINVGIVDNLQGIRSPFTIPTCPNNSGHLSITSGITPSPTNATIGEAFSASYYVKNDGGSNITFNQLRMDLTNPQGSTQTVRYDGGNTLLPGSGGTITFSTSNLGAGCITCFTGTYRLSVYWQDTSNNWHLIDTNGGTNGVNFTANDVSRKVTAFNFDTYGSYPVVYFKRGTDG